MYNRILGIVAVHSRIFLPQIVIPPELNIKRAVLRTREHIVIQHNQNLKKLLHLRPAELWIGSSGWRTGTPQKLNLVIWSGNSILNRNLIRLQEELWKSFNSEANRYNCTPTPYR